MEYNVSKMSHTNLRFDVLLESTTVDASNVQNLTTFCQADYVPSIEEYFTAFNVAGVVLFTMGGMAVTLTLITFADTLRHVLKNSPPMVKTHTLFVLSVYPVVAVCTYCAVVVPRAQLLAEAVTQGMFMASLYQLFCLLVAYCGGEAELISRAKSKSLNMKVGPCCCYPCCLLPALDVTKKHVRLLRMLVLQLPVVQGLLYMVLLVMWAEEESLYEVNYMYFQPIVITSILLGIWGMLMTIKMLTEVLRNHHMQGKFIVLQLVLLFAKLQSVIARVVVWTGGISCEPPITPTVYSNLIYNSAMLAEMLVLSFLARLLYKRELPELVFAVGSQEQPIAIVGEKVKENGVVRMVIMDSLRNNNNNNLETVAHQRY